VPAPRPGPRVPTSDGLEIATWDLGGAGPELVLTHGTGFHGRCWTPLAGVLCEAFHVWAIDQRGHGSSGHAADGRYDDWSRFADDLLRVVDHLDLDRPAVAGHSLGGAVAVMAEQAKPGTFAALFAYEPIILPADVMGAIDGNSRLRDLALKRRGTFPSLDDARANYAGKAPFARFRPDALDAYLEGGLLPLAGGAVALACPGPEEASVYEGAVRNDAFERLGELDLPVTLAGAAAGGDVDPDLIRRQASEVPGAAVELLEGVGHFGPMEDPDRIARLIVDAVA
jgi:pimeloyl-ACP methyl ester carboxylesterase